MKNLIVTIFIATFITHSVPVISQQTITGSFLFKNVNRNYRLRVPQNLDVNKPVSLVFNLHGFGSNAIQQELYSGMNAVADTAGFYVCYPNGVNAAWNVGWIFGSQADDVGFISALTDTLMSKYGIDAGRVYACGMSNGGFMSFRLGCELSSKIAAIGSVTGSIVPGRLGLCQPGRAVPAMIIHGTEDNTVPYNGSAISLAIEEVINFWVDNNGCSDSSTLEPIPNINNSDNSTAEKYIYNDCEPNGNIEFIKVLRGGHTWPGSAINTGVTNQDFKASVELWNFFRKFSTSETSLSNDIQYVDIQPSPNPVTDAFRLKGMAGNWSGIMFNLSGQRVMNFKNEDEQPITITNLDEGIYILVVSQNAETRYFKIIKI